MSVVSAISQGSRPGAVPERRVRASTPGPRPAEVPADGPHAAAISCQAYERLMAGEPVSWTQILREHPMLGQITVTELVNAGVVQVVPDYDPGTGQLEIWLHKPASSRVGDRKLKVVRTL